MDGEGRSTRQAPDKGCKCFSCKHLIEWPYCFAFLTGEGIPEDIRVGLDDHSGPHPGDHGVVYTPLSSPFELSEEGLRWLISEYKGMTIMPRAGTEEVSPRLQGIQREESHAPDPDGGYPRLIVAAAAGDLSRVRGFLERGADVNVQDAEGTSALISACRNCDLEMVKLLLRFGADVNLEDNSSRTPLYIANAWGYPTIADLLKDHGAVEPGLPGA